MSNLHKQEKLARTVSEIVFCIYFGMAIFTFGHAANKYFDEDTPHSMIPYITVMCGGTTWPFYWSWELQRKEPSDDK